jgi:hypothetical protein
MHENTKKNEENLGNIKKEKLEEGNEGDLTIPTVGG